MKITPRQEEGSILIVTLLTAVIVGIALAGTLEAVKQQNLSTHRSKEWNTAMAVSESGVEEALSHLRAVQSGNRATNGWATNSLSGGFFLRRTNGNTRYWVHMTADSAPTITSTGYSKLPMKSIELSRVVQVTTKGTGGGPKGLVSKGSMTFSGQFETDSYDSTDPNHSTGGMYDVAKRKDNGDIGSMAGGSKTIDMGGQVKIYGRASVAANGEIYAGSQSAVGTAAFINAGKQGIEPGRSSKDLNVSFPDPTIPSTAGAFGLPGGGKVGTVTYSRIFPAGNDKYHASTISLSGQEKWLIRGNATIIVDKDWSQSGQAYIQIEQGASLKIYVKEGSVSISGNGFVNVGGSPKDLAFIGPNHTRKSDGSIEKKGLENFNISGNGLLIGTIYATDAKLSISGGGNDTLDFVGAGIVGEVSGSGKFKFHYDEALDKNSAGGNLSIASWKEICGGKRSVRRGGQDEGRHRQYSHSNPAQTVFTR